ncbi:hypothetical protein GCM10027072_47250 [Streptomyces bullii]
MARARTAAPVRHGGDRQEAARVSAHSASRELLVRGIMDDLDGELPVLTCNGPGDYRLQIHAAAGTPLDLAPDEVTRVVPHPGPH